MCQMAIDQFLLLVLLILLVVVVVDFHQSQQHLVRVEVEIVPAVQPALFVVIVVN